MADTDNIVFLSVNQTTDEQGGTVYDIESTPVPLQTLKEIRLSKLPRLVGQLTGPRHVITGTLSRQQRTDYYSGEYVVTPSTEEQTLHTKNRMMSKDVLVEEIPYYETTNQSGGYTVIIG